MNTGSFLIPLGLIICAVFVLYVVWMLGRCQFKIIRRKKQAYKKHSNKTRKCNPLKYVRYCNAYDEDDEKIVNCEYKGYLIDKDKHLVTIDDNKNEKNTCISCGKNYLKEVNTEYISVELTNECGNTQKISDGSANSVSEKDEIENDNFLKHNNIDIKKSGNSGSICDSSSDNITENDYDKTDTKIDLEETYDETVSFSETGNSSSWSTALLDAKLENDETPRPKNCNISSIYKTYDPNDFKFDCLCNIDEENLIDNHCRECQIKHITCSSCNNVDIKINTGFHMDACSFSLYCCWNTHDASAQIINYYDKIKFITSKIARLYFTEQCVICQDEFNEQDQVCLLLCRHVFHMKCIMKWLAKRNRCPLCWVDVEKHVHS